MNVEFIARYPKEYTKEEQNKIDDEAKILMLLDSDLTLQSARNKVLAEEPQQYQYGPWVLEMNDVTDYNMVDKEHTRVVKQNGMSIVLKIPYHNFLMAYTMTTGRAVVNFNEFMPQPQVKNPTKKKKDEL